MHYYGVGTSILCLPDQSHIYRLQEAMELWYIMHKGVAMSVHLMDVQHHQSKLASAYAVTSRHVDLLSSDLQDNMFGSVGPPLVSDVRAVMASAPDWHMPLDFSLPPIDVGIKLCTLCCLRCWHCCMCSIHCLSQPLN